jgi:hypothetical protein
LSKLEKAFLKLPWEQVRESVEVKLIEQAGELYILSRSAGRVHKERSMRRRLKRLCKRLPELQQQKLTRDELLIQTRGGQERGGTGLCAYRAAFASERPGRHPADLHLFSEQKQTPDGSA